jgi:hypothetical protein
MNDVEIVKTKTVKCSVCEKMIAYGSATTPHPESPEFIQPPPGAWVGYLDYSEAPNEPPEPANRPIELVFACSAQCRSVLLSE